MCMKSSGLLSLKLTMKYLKIRDSLNTQPQTLIFLHIPKAGGTTLRRIIEKQFPVSSRFRIYQDTKTPLERFRKLAPENKRRIRCICGHMPFGLHRELEQPATYITMLRNPVSRIIAQYYYAKTHHRNYLYPIVTSKNMSLKEFVSSGISAELDNGQVRFISGTIPEELLADFKPVTREILDLAKANLNNYFSSVGIIEAFDESLLLMRRRLGWDNVFYVRRNVTRKNPERDKIPKDVMRLIERHNEYDLELYEFVKKKQKEEIGSLGDSFRDKLEDFRRRNKRFSKVYGPIDSIVYSVDRILTMLRENDKRAS